MADRGEPADRDLRRGAMGPTRRAENPDTDSLSSLGFGHGNIIEAYVSGTWPAAAAGVSDKRLDDLNGSDLEDSDDNCALKRRKKGVSRHPVSVRRPRP